MILTCAFTQTARDFGLLIASVSAIYFTRSFNKWQRRLEQEKLRFQLYDRRLGVYFVFRELLQTLLENGDDETKASFLKAAPARLEVPFLFADNPDLEACLEQICARVNDLA
jgi:hypothetical protein